MSTPGKTWVSVGESEEALSRTDAHRIAHEQAEHSGGELLTGPAEFAHFTDRVSGSHIATYLIFPVSREVSREVSTR